MLNVMITLFCVLTMLTPSHCGDLLSKIEVESSINRTVDEVEKLIRLNSTLPRLSRHEIVDILFNITSKDLEAYQDKETIEEARRIYQRALMVVLPYNAENTKEDINDLYTKPPIVEIIPDSSSPEDFKAWRNKKLEAAKLNKEPLENLVVTHASEKATKIRYKNHKETYSEVQTKVPLEVTMKFDSAPVKFSFDLDNLQKSSTITEKSETVKRPVYQRPPSYSVKNENASATSTISSKEPHTSMLPSAKYNGNILSVDQWRYNAPTSTTQNSIISAKTLNLPSSFLPTVKMSSLEDLVAPTAKSKNASQILKVTSGKMQVANTKQSTSTYVIPMSSSEKPKYSSTYNLNSGGFRTITTARPEVMDLLAAIGLRPENTTNVEEVFKKNKLNVEINSRIPDSDDVSYTVTSSLTTVDSPSVITQNAFRNPVPEIGKGMSNLTPDVQLLFQRFGLQASGNTVASVTTPTPKSTTNINSYTNFKPLPTSKIKDQEMREFLAKFGLGVSDASRQKKSMPTERPSLIEAVPRNMRQILENIGLIARTTPKTTTTTTTRTTTTATTRLENTKPIESTKFHVFKPHEVHVKDEQQRMKISQLLDTIRLVQEGKANATDVRKVANDLLETTKGGTLREGPDPLRLEEIIRIYNEDMKNEVKRQYAPSETTPAVINNSDPDTVANATSTLAESVDALSTLTTMTMTTTTTTTVNSTASDSAKDGSDLLKALTPMSSTTADANLLALEESFGGTTSAPNSVLPTKRRNGLYFLVDWNSFLEVGEGSEKVNLMFQPKVGDRSRFLPITVP